ncbi:SpaH/EbpB family LPXTG-anchored major pilin [Schleiferilactobacillus perolens]|uniref:SpaH/EbpB family LPXTG-anchored major pilin n=1 Tax=Schleiferilactobacillus perolens TaxID=100468 RepID=UPI00235690A7|nr:SpaH/EbpB family LPXTG-anchored major pilin [Schleiferilactobacillus perolens]MCI2172129.1 SpaH/EbpB family LPXTG-anchored major pilin [Schleiferilactobacillus perolens]
MKQRKWLRLVMLVTLVLPLLGSMLGGLTQGVRAATADSTVDITLHKKAFDKMPEPIENTGEVMDEFKDATPLDGVEFQAYNITKQFRDTLTGGPSGQETMKTFIARKMKDFVTAHGTPDNLNPKELVDTQTTANGGEAKFTKLPSFKDGQHQVYIFYETKTPESVTGKATPMIVVLPVMKVGTSEPNDNIHLYPKNEIGESEFKKEMVSEEGKDNTEIKDIEVGKQEQYYLEFTMPYDIGNVYKKDGKEYTTYQSFQFKDAVNKPGLSFVNLDKIVLTGTPEQEVNLKDHYTFTAQNELGKETADGLAGFELAFNLNDKAEDPTSKATAAALKPYANKKVRIYYTLQVNQFATPDQAMKNDATWTWNREGTENEKKDDAPQLITGGKKFLKVDGANDQNFLKDAKFVLTKGTGADLRYAQFTEDADGEKPLATYDVTTAKYVKWITDKEKATKLVSNDKGEIEVRGLEYGEYNLVETKAPDGFNLLNKPVTFKVALNSWSDAGHLTTIKNIPEGGLPSTGGPGIIMFLLAGFLVMCGGVVWYKFRAQPAKA